jgi:hypothetical protein
VIGLMVVAIPIAVVVIVVVATRKPRGPRGG